MDKAHFTAQYRELSDEDLIGIYHRRNEYTWEAGQALTDVLEERGGLDEVFKKVAISNEKKKEAQRIKNEIVELHKATGNVNFLIDTIDSKILSKREVEHVVASCYEMLNKEVQDRKVKPKTLIGGMFAALFSAVVGGILWGLQIIWSGQMFLIFGIGLVLFCYGTIKWITKQSYKNTAVFIFTLLAVLLALFIGQVLWEIIGRR